MSRRMLRRFTGSVCGCLLASAVLLRANEAKADMYWRCDGGCAAVVVLMMAGTAVVVGADVYYTVRAYETPISPQLGRNAIYWTSWQAGLLDMAAVAGLGQGRLSESDTSMGVLALGTWPLSITANGMWHVFPESQATHRLAVGMVAVSDVALLSYDALLLGTGRRAEKGLALAEVFAARVWSRHRFASVKGTHVAGALDSRSAGFLTVHNESLDYEGESRQAYDCDYSTRGYRYPSNPCREHSSQARILSA